MTDEELIKRLRSLDVTVRHAAAARIEALVKEVDAPHEEAMEWIAAWGHARKGQLEAEAKLAKAVEALKNIAHGGGYTDMQIARNVLAELEKTE